VWGCGAWTSTWYYSLFTLFMLLMFETTVVTSRLRTLTELRRVRVDPQTLLVHRGEVSTLFLPLTALSSTSPPSPISLLLFPSLLPPSFNVGF